MNINNNTINNNTQNNLNDNNNIRHSTVNKTLKDPKINFIFFQK